MTLVDLLKFKYPQIDFLKDVLLSDYGLGNGPEIREWNLQVARPTQEDLDSWEIEFDLAYRQKQARAARVYPAITDQLDMLYHDHKDDTTTWFDTIASIKLANPKPTE